MAALTPEQLSPSPQWDTDQDLANAFSFLDTSLPFPFDDSSEPRPPSRGCLSLMTPPSSSPSSVHNLADRTEALVERSTRFVPQPVTLIVELKRGLDREFDPPTTLKEIPASRLQKAAQSILKPSTAAPFVANPQTLCSSSPPFKTAVECARMLESIFKQLASPTRASRLDAYVSLLECLRYYNDIPGNDTFRSKMPLFEDFLMRDIQAWSDATNSIDTKLVTQASNVTRTFLYESSAKHAFSTDFLDFLIEYAISSISDGKMPKEVVKHHMQLLNSPELYKRRMTPAHVSKLVNSLSGIHERVGGQNVISLRFSIYRNILRKFPDLMLSTVENWLPHIMKGLSSGSSDTRRKAIDAGLCAANQLGHYAQTSLAMQRIFEVNVSSPSHLLETSAQSPTYFHKFHDRLMELLKTESDADQVPQIWTIIALMMRNKQYSVERWTQVNPWFRIIKRCFNASRHSLNLQAWTAWTQLIYALAPSASTRLTMVTALRQPLIPQLQRKATSKQSIELRDAAYSSYRCLLYYILRPSASAEELVSAWKANVDGILEKIGTYEVEDIGRLCEILTALLSTSRPVTWAVDKFKHDGSSPPAVTLGELPHLQPSWVRKHADMLATSISTLVLAAMAQGDEFSWHSATDLWRAFLHSLSIAGSREITLSAEADAAIVLVTDLVSSMYLTAVSSCKESVTLHYDLMERATLLLQTAIDIFGVLFFAESRSISSPSSRYRPTTEAEAPVVQLFIRCVEGYHDTAHGIEDFCTALLHPCSSLLPSRAHRLALLAACVAHLERADINDESELQGQRLAALWRTVASTCIEVLALEENSKKFEVKSAATGLNSDYKVIVNILRFGIHFTDAKSNERLVELLSTIVRRVSAEIGNAGILIALFTPLLATVTCAAKDKKLLPALSIINAEILDVLTHMNGVPGRKAMKMARDSLFSDDDLRRKDEDVVVHSLLYNKIDILLTAFRANIESTGVQHITRYLSSLHKYTSSASVADHGQLIASIETGSIAWLTHTFGDNVPTGIDEEFQKLWLSILSAIKNLEDTNGALLFRFENIFCGGLQSSSKILTKHTIQLWNEKFAVQQHLRVPERLSSLIFILKQIANMVELPVSMAAIEESSEEVMHSVVELKKLFPWFTNEEETQTKDAILSPGRGPLLNTSWAMARRPLRPQNDTTTPASIRRLTSTTKPPASKSRHNDSQVDFVTINSSPARLVMLESQMMTDHQQDVRSRQREDVAVFHEIRSSPIRDLSEKASNKKDNNPAGKPPAPASSDFAIADFPDNDDDGGKQRLDIVDNAEKEISPVETSIDIDEGILSHSHALPRAFSEYAATTSPSADDTAVLQSQVLPLAVVVDGDEMFDNIISISGDQSMDFDGSSASRPELAPTVSPDVVTRTASLIADVSSTDPVAEAMLYETKEPDKEPLPYSPTLTPYSPTLTAQDLTAAPSRPSPITAKGMGNDGAIVKEPMKTSECTTDNVSRAQEQVGTPRIAIDETSEPTALVINEDHSFDNVSSVDQDLNFSTTSRAPVSDTVQSSDQPQDLAAEIRGYEHSQIVPDTEPPHVHMIVRSVPEVVIEVESTSLARIPRTISTAESSAPQRRGCPKKKHLQTSRRIRSRRSNQPNLGPSIENRAISTRPNNNAPSESTRGSSAELVEPQSSAQRAPSPEDTITVIPRSTGSPSIMVTAWAQASGSLSSSQSQGSGKFVSRKRKSSHMDHSPGSQESTKRAKAHASTESPVSSSVPRSSGKRKAAEVDECVASQVFRTSVKRRRFLDRMPSPAAQTHDLPRSSSGLRRSVRLSSGASLSPMRQASASQVSPSEVLKVATESPLADTPAIDAADDTTKVSSASDVARVNTLPPAARVGGKVVSEYTSSIAPAIPPTSSTQIDDDAHDPVDGQPISEDAPSPKVTHADPSSAQYQRDQPASARPRPANITAHDASLSTVAAGAVAAAAASPSAPPSPFRALQNTDMHDDLETDLSRSGDNAAPGSPAGAMAAAARKIIARLRRIVVDASTLVLGPGEVRERREIEDLMLDAHREIVSAGRRGEAL